MVAMDLGMQLLGKRSSDGGTQAENAEGAASAAKHRKHGGKGGAAASGNRGGAGNIDKLVMDIGRLALHASREAAMVKGIVSKVLVFSKKEDSVGLNLFNEMKAISANYTKEAKKMSKEEKAQYVSPHVFVWQGYLEWFKEKYSSMGAANKINEYLEGLNKEMEQHIEQAIKIKILNKDEPEAVTAAKQKCMRDLVADKTRLFKVAKCYDTTKAKIEFASQDIPTQVIYNYTVGILKQEMGAQEKAGQAPKSELERRVEKQVYKQNSNED
eukprot:TRINITY_DN26532_c0_g2_i1.p2 TRINITY_DN26532_c0_g2~~TRINITY_DN26532_c0_g2_i1.p2  ORF type:complete len:270 (-),score=115.02 TRINITY_DN26532_c0_g2_i1:413-1222(-)